MESMMRSISAKDYKHTGVPLITKLVAEFLESKISHTTKSTFYKTRETLLAEKFSLWNLYENFVAKSFHIYFTEKRGINVKNAINRKKCNEEKRIILENYKIYAIQEFLKKDAAKFFLSLANRKFSEFEIEEMVKVGLIYKTDDGYKFVHQTFAEYLFTLHLMKNFEQPMVAKFIVNFVFIEEKFEVIRSFVEFWVEEKKSPENCETYFEVLSECPAEHTTPIHVSAKEQNSKIIDFIYNCLTKNSKFASGKSKVVEYLFKFEKSNLKAPAIFDLLTWPENLNQVLDSVRKDFGEKFVREIFNRKFKAGYGNFNLTLYNSQFGENLPNILEWLRLNFPNDLEFLEKQIFSVFETHKRGILHHAFWFFSNPTLLSLLNELENWRKAFGKDLIRKLILMENENNRLLLFYYVQKENFDTVFSIEFLKKLKVHFESDDSFLIEFIFHVDKFNRTFLHRFCAQLKNFDLLKFLKWFRDDFGLDDLQKLLQLRDVNQQSIILKFISNERNTTFSCFEVLNYLKVVCQFDESFLRNEVILQNNKSSENILQQIFLRSADLDQFDDFVEDFKITDSELKASFVDTGTFFFYFAQKPEESQEKIESFLESKFGGNFLDELFSDETLCNVCWNSHRFDDFAASVLKFFDFVERKFGLDFLMKLICFRNSENQIFLFHIYDVVVPCLMKILHNLFEKFKIQKDFLAEVLLSVNNDGNTFLIYNFSKGSANKMVKISKDFFNAIKSNFGLDYLKKLLLIKNKQNRNFHLDMLCNKRCDGVGKSLDIFKILLEVVGKDKDFFSELTKQDEIPEQIKEFLVNNIEN
jgi:hypothetical protein